MPQWIHFIYPQQWFPNTIRCLHGINLVTCWFSRFIPSPLNFLPLDPTWKLLWYVASDTDKRNICILVFSWGFFVSLPKLFDTLNKGTLCEFRKKNQSGAQPYLFSPCILSRFWMFSLLFFYRLRFCAFLILSFGTHSASICYWGIRPTFPYSHTEFPVRTSWCILTFLELH